jgi:hypothetical protein
MPDVAFGKPTMISLQVGLPNATSGILLLIS